jgi:hypothetical protein
MLDAHAQAVIGLFPSGLTPLDGLVPDGRTLPYVLLTFRFSSPDGTESPDKTNLSFDQSALRAEVVCHSVATTALGARVVAARVRTALLNVAPAVSGRSCFPIRHVDGQDPRRDEDTQTTVFDQVDVYRFESVPG